MSGRTIATMTTALVAALLLALSGNAGGATAPEPCATAPNPTVCENAKPGNPSSEWDVSGSGDPTIQGFATEFSVQDGEARRLQDQDRRGRLPDRHLPDGLLRRLGGPKGRDDARRARRCRKSQPTCFERHGHRAGRLRELGRVGALAAFRRVPSRGSTSPTSFATDTGGDSHVFFVVRDDDGALGPALPDLGHDLAGLQPLRRQQPLPGVAGRPRVQGQLQPPVHDPRLCEPPPSSGEDEYPMVRWLERNGYDVSYLTGIDTRPARRRAPRAQGLPLGRPRRVLVWRAARQRRSGAGRRGQPRLLQQQRDLLEDTLGDVDRRVGHAVPDARLVQGDEGRREDRSDFGVDWNLARRALQPAVRRRPAGERPDRPALHGRRLPQRPAPGARRVRTDAALAEHERRLARAGPGRDVRQRDRSATSSTRTSTTAAPAGLVRLSSTTVDVDEHLIDEGTRYVPGTATHNLTMYRHSSGALVFGAGTVAVGLGARRRARLFRRRRSGRPG